MTSGRKRVSSCFLAQAGSRSAGGVELGEEPDFFAHFGEAVVSGDGNLHLVANALAADHGAGGPGFRKRAFDEGNHFKKLPVLSGRRKRNGADG